MWRPTHARDANRGTFPAPWRWAVFAALTGFAGAQCRQHEGPLAPTPAPSCTDAPAVTAPVVLAERFDDACFSQRGWYDHTDAPVTATEHAPGSAKSVEFHFPAGATKPVGGEAMRHTFPASRAVYLSYRVKYSKGWIGSGKPYHPHEFMILSTMDDAYAGPSYTWMTLYVEQNYDGGGRPRLAIQDSRAINALLGALPLSLIGITDERSTSGCNGPVESGLVSECYDAPPWTNNKQLRGPVEFAPSPGAGYIGDWNLVEAYFRLNTITNGVGQSDGVMQYWFNGALVLDRHDIQFVTAPRTNLRLNQLVIAPYIGDGSPVDQTMWVDDLIVATDRVARQ